MALEGDGSAMYTIQALWTQAREGLNVTNVILANRSYAILNMEMMRMGLGEPGPAAKQMLDLTRPELVRDIHERYLAAGADITTTNTFTATSIGQADYGLEDAVYELNVAGANVAPIDPVDRARLALDPAGDLELLGIVEGGGRRAVGIVDHDCDFRNSSTTWLNLSACSKNG